MTSLFSSLTSKYVLTLTSQIEFNIIIITAKHQNHSEHNIIKLLSLGAGFNQSCKILKKNILYIFLKAFCLFTNKYTQIGARPVKTLMTLWHFFYVFVLELFSGVSILRPIPRHRDKTKVLLDFKIVFNAQ